MSLVNVKIGRRFAVVLPPCVRASLDAEEGGQLVFQTVPGGVLIRPAAVVAVRKYSRREKAAFLLENAVDREGYAGAREEVEAMGIDPDSIPHTRPKTRR